LEIEGLKRDPTFFSAINQSHQTTVQRLLICTEDALPKGAFPEDFDNFKSVYLDAAFIAASGIMLVIAKALTL
jgi:hypothetical protein